MNVEERAATKKQEAGEYYIVGVQKMKTEINTVGIHSTEEADGLAWGR